MIKNRFIYNNYTIFSASSCFFMLNPYNVAYLQWRNVMQHTYTEIKEKADQMRFKNLAFINGRYVNASSGATFDCINPGTGQLLTQVAACDATDVDLAVKAARTAFNSGAWSRRPPRERKAILLKFADLIEKHQFELAIVETLDMGKPIENSLQGDLPYASSTIRWYAEAIDKLYDEIAPTANNVLAMVTREPLGVIAAVLPWNFPFAIACARIAPALAMGNSIIIKPAEQSPLTTLYLGELAAEAGIPDGVLNVLPGWGEVTGKALGLHHDVDGITFTGSSEVGKLFLRYSSESNMKRISLECGGKSPNIVMADCEDLDKAALASAQGVFFNQGEVCCAPTRLLVEESIKEKFLEKLSSLQNKFQPGDPLDPKTVMGAMVDKTQMQRVLKYIELGKSEGANLTFGGKQALENSGGYFIEPTVFSNVKNNMTIAKEEIFGPVLATLSFKNVEEAIKIANETHYGLAASLWTRDLNKAHKTARALRAGVVSVNCIESGDSTTPFGGYKQSGMGRESSLHSLNFYTELKTTWIELS